MTTIEFVPLLALGLTIYTLTNFVKYLRNGDWNAAVTLVVAWVIGCLAVWLVGETSWGATIGVGGSRTLDQLDFPETLLVGLVVTSAGSGIFDFKKSFDASDSAATPTLVHPPVAPPPAPTSKRAAPQ